MSKRRKVPIETRPVIRRSEKIEKADKVIDVMLIMLVLISFLYIIWGACK